MSSDLTIRMMSQQEATEVEAAGLVKRDGVIGFVAERGANKAYILAKPLIDQWGRFNSHLTFVFGTGTDQWWLTSKKKKVHRFLNAVMLGSIAKD